MIARCAPVLAIAFVIEVALLVAGTPDAATTGAALICGVSLAAVYADLLRSGEYHGLVAGGIAPRRIVAPVVILLVLLQALVVAFCYRFERPDVPSAYIGYTLSAAQPILIASSALPICVRSSAREPWAQVLLLLLAYVGCLIAAQMETRVAGIGAGLYWLYIVPALVAIDVVLFRHLAQPARSA
jgi:hypothetical protein